MNTQAINSSVNINAVPRLGTVMIVDISGFTDLVYATDVVAGTKIVFQLLSSVIKANELQLQIAEIEGDAVFFYRFGLPPSKRDVLLQYERMLNSFLEAVRSIPELYSKRMPLSLKMVVHYGDIAQYQLGGFDKLYGKVVTEAHMLLKNNVPSHTYVLMSDDYLHSVSSPEQTLPHAMNSQCEIFAGSKKLCYSSYDYS